MTPAKLFRTRLAENARFQYRLVRMAVDWTVALYIVIPALLFGAYQYSIWWQSPPELFTRVTVGMLATFLYVAAILGGGEYRFFVLEADQLFLRGSASWTTRLLRLGIVYSAAKITLGILALAALLLPLLRSLPASPAHLLRLFVAGWALGLTAGLVRCMLQLSVAGWRLWLARWATTAVAGLAFALLAWLAADWPVAGFLPALLLLAFAWQRLARMRLRLQGAFLREVELDYRIKMRLANYLLSGFTQKPRKRQRRLPAVFRRSQLLFRRRSPIAGLSEALLKSFLRSWTQLRMYALFLAAASAAILLVPNMPVRAAIWLSSAFMLSYWMKLFCKEVASTPFLALFPWEDATRIGALRKCTHLLMLPGFLAISMIFGYGMGAWLGVLLFAAIGYAVAYVISATVTIWY